MADREATPRASDDLETAERKSKTVDERVPMRQDTDVVPEVVLPGAVCPLGEMMMTFPVPGSVAARSMPLLISPRICRGARLATTMICLPMRCSG